MDSAKAEEKIISFIRGYFKEAGRKTAVVGVSGGLDSAATLALCVRALGKKNVTAVLMDSDATPARDKSDAALICRLLKVEKAQFPIGLVLRAYGKLGSNNLSKANLSARIRMAALYSLASQNNGLVVGTGDKSEFLLGYFTKHGDGGADLFPIGGLYKTEVKMLAAHLGIPQSIIGKPPSPALWKGHTAKDELGFSYDEADAVLSSLDRGEQREKIEERFGEGLVKKIMGRMGKNQHKLSPAPICKI